MIENELTDEAYWDKSWETLPVYKPLATNHPYFGKDGTFVRMIRRYVGNVENMRILEVGAGGDNHRLLALHRWGGAQVSGVDYSQVGLRILLHVFQSNNGVVETIHGDFLKLPPPEQKYDMVVHWGVIEHFSDPLPMLRACQAALRPGGRLLFSMPNMDAWAAIAWARFSPANWAKHVYHSDQGIRRACEDAQFEVNSTFYFGGVAVEMANWERSGAVPFLLNCGQRFANLASRFMPDLGNRRLCMERGVVARARSTN
jgi:2-polyprenyl-3-methyl-5-hydroxy-6-metoxy-1,4-benzoquinol methylase